MKLHFRFPICVIFLVVLVCSAPFTTSAQQDTDAMILQATTDAIKDVDYHHNKIRTALIGAGIPLIGCCIGLSAGCLFSVETTSGLWGDSRVINPYAFFGSMALTTAVGYWVLSSYNLEPPAFRVLGKPPKYVEVYTDVYIKKMRSQRLLWSAIGTSAWVITIPGFITEDFF